MTIKEIFDKANSENKSLTYEEFEKLAKEGKAKFTDLSEGKYVDKQKYDDDLATKGTEINGYKETIAKRDGDLKDLQTKLEEAGGDADKIIQLTNEMTALQGKYDADIKGMEAKLSAQAYEFAVRDFASTQKFSSKAAEKYFIEQMIQKNLPMENGSIMGAADFAKAYAKENADSFVKAESTPKAEQPKPQFAGNTGNNNSGVVDPNGFNFNFAALDGFGSKQSSADSNVTAGLSMPNVVNDSNFYAPPTN